jgi:NADPH-dependent 2,4-dienoyl-CoA reductase/sulfur reductase-like enzyme
MKHIVIIGNGIAGITAARHIRKQSDHRITIISGETDHFFSRTALMYIYMGHLTYDQTKPYEDSFWKKNRLELKRAYVERVEVEGNELVLSEGGTITYDELILAVGSKPSMFGWPGQDLKAVQGLYSYQDLEKLEAHAPNNSICKRAVIVGGGLIGIELAEMLHSRQIAVTFLVRESSFWNGVLPNQDSELINREIWEHHIDLKLNTNLKEILPDENGRARAVVIEETGKEVACDLVGLTAGVRPNIDFLKDSPIETGKGILVDRELRTNIPNIYAIGDCAEQREPVGGRRAVEAVWYTGRMMGEAVAQTLCGRPTPYNPGPWFNSAKFFTIEYQTYGWVSGHGLAPEWEVQFHWRDSSQKRAVTIAYHRESKEFLGINTFGIRLRHDWFDQCLRQKRDVHYVLKNLPQANFDPEFYQQFSASIARSFQTTNPAIKP